MSYVDNYYARSLENNQSYPSLDQSIEVDVCIVGAGLAGVTIALQLIKAGKKVALLDAEKVGWGASGRNGGFVGIGYANGHEAIKKKVGVEHANLLHAMSIEGQRFVKDTINDLQIHSAKPVHGILSTIRYSDRPGMMKKVEELKHLFNYPVEYLESDELRAVLNTTKYHQAIRDPFSFHMHPLNYLRGVVAEVTRLGGLVFENSRVMHTKFISTEKIVYTSQGQVKAQDIVFTTGGYTSNVVPELKKSYLPIATYVMLTEANPDLIQANIKTTDAIYDDRRAADYYRVVDDGQRILWGGRISTLDASPVEVTKQLRNEMLGVYPELTTLKTEVAWSGLMSYAKHLMPQIGRLPNGIWYCTAFGGHGLNTTAIGGKVIAEAILEQSDRYRLFAPFGLEWTGGWAGLAAAQLTYWKLQFQDYLKER